MKFRFLNFLLFIFVLWGGLTACGPMEEATKPSSNTLVEDFEGGSKGTYAQADVQLATGTWSLDGALIGTTDSDKKKGQKAARVQDAGRITARFKVTAGTVTISHAKYGSDPASTWELWTSPDGRSWSQAGSAVNTTSGTLQTASFTINAEVRLEIRHTGGGRLNIDNIVIEKSTATGSTTSTSGGSTTSSGGSTTGGSTTPGRDNHLAMGNPSAATTSTSNADNYLMQKSQYALSYNNSKGIANWVSWHLSSAWKGGADRQDDFRPDDQLPSGFNRVTTSDYTGSGFDRGHMCPSDDRDASVEDNSATFLMTNMVPQAPENNQQTWKYLEDYCRDLAAKNMEMYIICGSYGIGGTGRNGGTTRMIANGKVTVPARTWKVVVVLPVGSNDVSRITSGTRVIAIDVPNTPAAADKTWGDFRVSVDAIEAKTGLDLLNAVPKAVQDALESKVDSGPTQ